MKLSEFMIKEDAGAGATSAGSIATVPASNHRRSKMMQRAVSKRGSVEKIKYSNPVTIKEAKEDTNVSAIVARLNAAKHRGQTERPYVTFGLEDQRGNIVRVKVAADQSQEFEQALARTLEDEDSDPRDIGEVIYDFKDRFDILGIDWPRTSLEEADEETTEEPETDEEPEDQEPLEDLDDAEDDEELPPVEEPAQPPESTGGASGNELNTTLIAIVDMLKSEIEAKKAEARAREKEAEAQQAKYAAEISANKVRAEQDILDMEAWNKKNSAEQKEARKLAMLAKYRYEKGQAEKEDRELDSYQMVGRFNKS